MSSLCLYVKKLYCADYIVYFSVLTIGVKIIANPRISVEKIQTTLTDHTHPTSH